MGCPENQSINLVKMLIDSGVEDAAIIGRVCQSNDNKDIKGMIVVE
ncbi:MAG: hypothetical protein HQK61_12330 [Desulfamplus sp.]|nr:hypothetical protein [Desulfamplus sp.]